MKRALLIACTTFLALEATAQSKFQSIKDDNNVTDLTLDSLEKAATARPIAGSSRKGQNPVLFLVGNSTMRTGTLGNGNNGQWGWGFYAQNYFDKEKITVENHALGGTSSRTFYNRLWQDVTKGIRPGDYVIVELGHNDNGPFDSGRARASIKGISPTDSLCVTIQETGQRETVYSYGEYLRRFVRETRALGAHPILMSLTPRNAYAQVSSQDAPSARRVARVDRSFGLWARQIAEELDCAFVDLNEISAAKFDEMSEWKFNYHFYLDHIHTSAFGAQLNARSACDGLLACAHPEVQALKTMMTNTQLPTTGVKRTAGKPVLFITGDSTVKNEDRDEDGMWGWGSQAATVFDESKITIMNCAQAGRSCRSYLREGRWDKVCNDLQPGDYVLIQFGHNDAGNELAHGKARNDIMGTADSSHVYRVNTGSEVRHEVVYTFGWYLRKMIDDTRQKGATPILVSLTPRNEWTFTPARGRGRMSKKGKAQQHIERRNESFGRWYREVVEQTGVALLDLHNISADAFDKLGREKTQEYFKRDHTHTSLKGARLNAQSIRQGLKKMKSPLAKYLL
ncbi:MAG: rhamnogalacturonan acetylesterase [Bacteroidales bacterium]|nr:rhamnogalacturonan acetylesterase [Candidatus Physcousia equi]